MPEQKVSILSAFKTIIWPRRKLVFIGLLLIVISKAASFVTPVASKYLIDDVIVKKDVQMLKLLVAGVIIAIFIQAVTSFLLTKILSVQAQFMISELRADVQKKVLSLPIRFFDNTKSGNLVSRIMTDVQGIRNLIGTGLVQLVGRYHYRCRRTRYFTIYQSGYDRLHLYSLGYFCPYRPQGI